MVEGGEKPVSRRDALRVIGGLAAAGVLASTESAGAPDPLEKVFGESTKQFVDALDAWFKMHPDVDIQSFDQHPSEEVLVATDLYLKAFNQELLFGTQEATFATSAYAWGQAYARAVEIGRASC